MGARPTGTVTFLFTDIEGSTKLWEQYPHTAGQVLSRHDAILHKAISAHGGLVLKTVGDSLLAAFAVASDALDAALEAQHALYSEQWPDTITLRVRMALHTGSTDEQEGDYTGPAVTRAARLVDAGNGGQIILSVTTQELLSVSLPPHTELRDMGERRLKDLTRPERIFQVIAPGLPAVFPPLRTLDRAITPVPPCGPRPRSACGKRSATRTVLPSR